MRVDPDLLRKTRTTLNINPEEATYLHLDIPLIKALPPANKWNQSMLLCGLDKLAQPHLLKSDHKLPAITLENVILQLNPLETAFYYNSAANEVLSALWIVRQGDVFQFTVFYTHKDHVSLTSLSLEILFSKENSCFEVDLKNKRVPLLQSKIPTHLIKGFFISLYIVQGLSSSIKPDPFLTIEAGNRGILPISKAALNDLDPNLDGDHRDRINNLMSIFS
jgi:hypothetical protein